MESETVDPDDFDPDELDVSDEFADAVDDEIGFLRDDGREILRVRLRSSEDRGVFQVTIQADDEMYRMSEVSPGHISRTVFRDPEPDDAMPYQEEDEDEDEGAPGTDEGDEG